MPKRIKKIEKKIEPVVHDLACALATVFFQKHIGTHDALSKEAAESFCDEYLNAVEHLSSIDRSELLAKRKAKSKS